jgi:hypothetical protein
MKHLIALLILFVLFAQLTGCKESVPKCSDDDTIALVKDIVAKQIDASDKAASDEIKAQMVVQFARASGFNEAIKKYDCEAKLIAAGTYQLPITYESQIDDNGQHIVAVGGMQRADLYRVGFLIGEKIKQAREEAAKSRESAKQAAAPAPAPQPTPAAKTQPKPVPAPTPATEPKTVAEPQAPSPEVPQTVRTFIEQSYGPYDAKHDCWLTKYESQAYCMKVVRSDRITADTGDRFYLLVGGQPFEEGEPVSTHALAGLAGAFVFEIRDAGMDLAASNKTIYVGASGIVPDHWDLVKLAKTGYYGWQTTSGDCHMGLCGSGLVILAPFGKSVKNIAGFTVKYSDVGACENQQCTEGPSSIESNVTIDTTAADSVYPLLVTLKGKLKGRELSGTTYRLEFDRKAWQYSLKADWPLADLEY